MKTYAGIDLHSSNNYIGVINAKDKRLYSKRHDNRIEDVLKVLGKFKAGNYSSYSRCVESKKTSNGKKKGENKKKRKPVSGLGIC